MLRFLLDEHISPVVAEQLNARRPEIAILSFHTWESGRYLNTALQDPALLTRAFQQSLTLVSYDQRTIRPLLLFWLTKNFPTAA